MLRALVVSLKLLPDLYPCVKALGWNLGWRYWIIVRRAALRPELALEWARACRLNTIAQPADAVLFHKWADELEQSYNNYMELTQPKELVWTAYDADYWEARPVREMGYFVTTLESGAWWACVIHGTTYKRVMQLPDIAATLAEAKAVCAEHWVASQGGRKL